MDQCLNLTNLYYLYPKFKTGFVSPSFSETNYYTWSRNMKMVILSKNKLKFVDGNISKANKSDSNLRHGGKNVM